MIDYPPAEGRNVFAGQQHSPPPPTHRTFPICKQTAVLHRIPQLLRCELRFIIKPSKMTQSAGGRASGKMLSMSCQQCPPGPSSHGTGREGIVSSRGWLGDHTGPHCPGQPGVLLWQHLWERTGLHAGAPPRMVFLQAEATETVGEESGGAQGGERVDLERGRPPQTAPRPDLPLPLPALTSRLHPCLITPGPGSLFWADGAGGSR